MYVFNFFFFFKKEKRKEEMAEKETLSAAKEKTAQALFDCAQTKLNNFLKWK